MAKLPVNPLKWFKGDKPASNPPPRKPAISVKQPAQPKKSGSIFMHLITLQKNLQSLELALRQDIDCKWLVQKTKAIVSALQLEADIANEEELSQGTGQILAYLDTVLEGRLEVDDDGVVVILAFVRIFKVALGDAAPGIRVLDGQQLEAWEEKYQRLMSRMKPIEGEVPPPEPQSDPEEAQPESPASTLDLSEPQEAPVELIEPEVEPEEDYEEAGELPEEALADPEIEPLESPPDDSVAPADEPDLEEEAVEVDISDLDIRDVVISDAGTKSARELLDSQEPLPIPDSPISDSIEGRDDATEREPDEADELEEVEASAGRNGENFVKNPVQLEEVERLKHKLLQLHEKQEMLSTRMTGILGDLKKAVQSEQQVPEHEPEEEEQPEREQPIEQEQPLDQHQQLVPEQPIERELPIEQQKQLVPEQPLEQQQETAHELLIEPQELEREQPLNEEQEKEAETAPEKEQEPVSVEKLDIDEIENLIFIGRKKG